MATILRMTNNYYYKSLYEYMVNNNLIMVVDLAGILWHKEDLKKIVDSLPAERKSV